MALRARSLLPAALATLLLGCPAAEEGGLGSEAPDAGGLGRPNVLLVVLDTTRAEAVSAWGDPQAHTPVLDRLAAEGARFANARATSSWTLPTHATLFTGLFSFQHGAHHETDRLVADARTLAERLGPTHETAGFSENPHIIRAKGFAQGFDVYAETWRGADLAERDGTVDAFRDWFRERDRDRPFFAFVNLFSTHLPYAPPERWQQRLLPAEAVGSDVARAMMAFGETQARLYMAGRLRVSPATFRFLRRLYLADAAWTDERLGALLAPLRQSGELDDTLVVVVGDHGEYIGEHGLMEHQFGLHETVLHVPLVTRWPGQMEAGTVREGPVQLVDVAPTVLDAAGMGPASWRAMSGTSLLRGDPPADRPVLAEFMRPLQQRALFERVAPDFDFARFDRRLKSLQVGDRKLILAEDGEAALYHLDRDPRERRDLAAERPEEVRRLRERLLEIVGGFEPAQARTAVAPPDLDPEAREALRKLGYAE